MQKNETVLLWGNDDILITSIKNILGTAKNLEVVVMPENIEIDNLHQAIRRHKAESVIIHQDDPHLMSMISIRLLRDNPGLKLVTVNLDNNEVEIFSKVEIIIKAASDLISIVRNGSF